MTLWTNGAGVFHEENSEYPALWKPSGSWLLVYQEILTRSAPYGMLFSSESPFEGFSDFSFSVQKAAGLLYWRHDNAKPSLPGRTAPKPRKEGDRMKLYLTGSVASGNPRWPGRSQRAQASLPFSDEVVYVPDPGAPSGEPETPGSGQDALFAEILRQPLM